MNEEIQAAEREYNSWLDRLGRLASSDALSKRNGYEAQYAGAYQRLVRPGARGARFARSTGGSMPDNERARIRQIMYEPSAVWLSTENSGDRWLTDQFVLYNVTGAEVLQCYDPNLNYGIEWPDGPYQLMATGDWRAKQRDSIPEPDIEAYFGIMAETVTWVPVEPSEWSVAEHPGKAMLWATASRPCLLGESTWTAIKRHHPDVLVDWAPNAGAGTFRFSEPEHIQCSGRECDCPAIPFAYAAGIRIPEGQEHVAHAIASASQGGSYSVIDRTSNEKAA